MVDEFPPSELIYKSFIYKYKTELTSCKLSYRCKFRNKCKVIMNVNKDDLRKYLSKEIEKIDVIYPGKAKNNHKCKGVKEKYLTTSTANLDEILTLREAQDIAIKIMKNIIEKPFSYHKTTLENANIMMPDNWIKNQLQKIREEKFPPNELYLSNICAITID